MSPIDDIETQESTDNDEDDVVIENEVESDLELEDQNDIDRKRLSQATKPKYPVAKPGEHICSECVSYNLMASGDNQGWCECSLSGRHHRLMHADQLACKEFSVNIRAIRCIAKDNVSIFIGDERYVLPCVLINDDIIDRPYVDWRDQRYYKEKKVSK